MAPGSGHRRAPAAEPARSREARRRSRRAFRRVDARSRQGADAGRHPALASRARRGRRGAGRKTLRAAARTQSPARAGGDHRAPSHARAPRVRAAPRHRREDARELRRLAPPRALRGFPAGLRGRCARPHRVRGARLSTARVFFPRARCRGRRADVGGRARRNVGRKDRPGTAPAPRRRGRKDQGRDDAGLTRGPRRGLPMRLHVLALLACAAALPAQTPPPATNTAAAAKRDLWLGTEGRYVRQWRVLGPMTPTDADALAALERPTALADSTSQPWRGAGSYGDVLDAFSAANMRDGEVAFALASVER